MIPVSNLPIRYLSTNADEIAVAVATADVSPTKTG
jgi:hypothetical protein